ncbi:unannotated protein [freshwater metagenome]|uniref:Unannotated protein n=1 Tax=freshwater metagenome TaxID=449393 RepID=A0A6J7UDY2_9ZZZZ
MTLLVPLVFEEVEVSDETVDEAWGVLFVVAEGAQQREDAEATLACHSSASSWVFSGLLLDVELNPLTAVRVDGSRHELMLGQVTKAEPLPRLEDHTR